MINYNSVLYDHYPLESAINFNYVLVDATSEDYCKVTLPRSYKAKDENKFGPRADWNNFRPFITSSTIVKIFELRIEPRLLEFINPNPTGGGSSPPGHFIFRVNYWGEVLSSISKL